LIHAKRIGFVGVVLTAFGLGSLTMSAGCSSNTGTTLPVQTDEQKAREKKDLEDLNKANDDAAKAAASRR
jgi:hypothetical protein